MYNIVFDYFFTFQVQNALCIKKSRLKENCYCDQQNDITYTTKIIFIIKNYEQFGSTRKMVASHGHWDWKEKVQKEEKKV